MKAGDVSQYLRSLAPVGCAMVLVEDHAAGGEILGPCGRASCCIMSVLTDTHMDVFHILLAGLLKDEQRGQLGHTQLAQKPKSLELREREGS